MFRFCMASLAKRIAQEGSMGFWSAFAFGGLALWTAALIGMTWLVKRAPLAKG
jgi:hypothetical protein